MLLKNTLMLLVAIALVAGPALAQAGVAEREILAVSYPEGRAISVKLSGTARLPAANGEAKVERKRGYTEVEIELDEMVPAMALGSDFTTYVLWAVSPEGLTDNLGEFILQGNRSKLNVTTNLQTFGMLVTAEPYSLVEKPSGMIVLENVRPKQEKVPLQVTEVIFEVDPIVAVPERTALLEVHEQRQEIPVELLEAHKAIEIAEREGAGEFAPEALARARTALRQAELLQARKAEREMISDAALHAVQLAAAARDLADERGALARLRRERLARQEEIRAAEERARLAELRARAAAGLEAERERLERREARLEEREAEMKLERRLKSLAPTREDDRGLVVVLEDNFFEPGSATLTPAGEASLREIGRAIAGFPTDTVIVQAFAAPLEAGLEAEEVDEQGLALAEARAANVMRVLVESGVKSEKIVTSALAADDGEERVEILIVRPE